MAKLSTHVLDTANGKPAEGIKLDFYRVEGATQVLLKSLVTNNDGRTDELLLDDSTIQVGEYAIVFHVAEYFSGKGVAQTEPAFLNRIPIHFGIFDAEANYHVPLLVSPWSYSTYRGS
jgi:5-hydroxyisourate hydrolase